MRLSVQRKLPPVRAAPRCDCGHLHQADLPTGKASAYILLVMGRNAINVSEPFARPSSNLAVRAAMMIALAAAPLSASSAQTAAAAPELQSAPQTSADQIPFAAHFTGVIEPLGPDFQDIDLVIPDSAVDLDTFEPPIEQTRVISNLGTGVASFYGRRFHGRRTANGERFDMRAMTAAHKTLPFGSLVRVTNPSNGRSVTVRINDRGPFIRGRTIDLSRRAAEELGIIRRGHATVELELVAP